MTSSQNLLLPIQQVFSDLGIVGSGYKVYTYQTQTVSTPLTTYSNIGLSIANPNPLVTLTNGRFANQAWVANKNLVKLVITDPNDVVIQTIDPVDNFSNSDLNTFNPIPAVYIGTTAGTNTAYTITSLIDISQVGYNSDDVFIITFDQACGASPTLAIDGLSALSLVKYTGQGATTPLIPGDVQNQRYFITISGSNIIVLNPRTTMLYAGTPPTLTASANAITLTNNTSNYNVNTSSSSITLNTINGLVAGQRVILGISSASNALTIATGAGNIINPNGTNIVLKTVNEKVEFIFDGINALVLWSSFLNDFESAEQTITNAGALTIAHGLASIPKKYQAFLKCKTAELGYSIGDETLVTWLDGGGAGGYGLSIVPDATNLVCRYGDTNMVILNKTTGAEANITNGNWKVIIRASVNF